MKKTLLEYHFEFRIESLRDDPGINYSKYLATIEFLAKEHGWRHLCERECISIKTKNIYTA
jgi:hypothetical protein